MTLTPASLRLDLKCGKGSISKGEKCTKGSATQAKGKSKEGSLLSKALVVGGAAATIGGIAYTAHKMNRVRAASNRIGERQANGRPADFETNVGHGRKAFRELKKTSLGVKVAGAGLTAAGVGLMKYGSEKKNSTATTAGAGLTYLGLSTTLGGFKVSKGFKEAENEFEDVVREQRRRGEEARQQARERARASGNRQGSRNVGSNAAVENPFKDLGVNEHASDAEVKEAWKRLMRQNHPDIGGDPEKAKKYNAAYQEILRRRGKMDSIFADGFTIDWDAIAI